MAVRFGLFVPQGWRLDLTEIAERPRPVIDAGIDDVIHDMPRVASDHGPIQHDAREVIPHGAAMP